MSTVIAKECDEELGDMKCHREPGHGGKHQTQTFKDDDHYNLQIVEWWSIKPNGDPVEEDNE